MCGDRGDQIERGPRKTCFAGKANPIPATIQKQLVQSDGLFLRFLVRKRGLAPLTQGRQRGVPAPHHFPRLMKGCPLSFPVPVQKEEGLREEHGSFPRRKLRRGPHLIKPPQSPEKPAPCGIAPLSRRGADRARPALRCRNGVSAETPAIRREPLCAATEAVKCKRAPAKPVLRGRQIPSPQPS